MQQASQKLKSSARNLTNKSSNLNASREVDDRREIEALNKSSEDRSADEAILAEMIAEQQKSSTLRQIFDETDSDRSGHIDLEEFLVAYNRVNEGPTPADI